MSENKAIGYYIKWLDEPILWFFMGLIFEYFIKFDFSKFNVFDSLYNTFLFIIGLLFLYIWIMKYISDHPSPSVFIIGMF